MIKGEKRKNIYDKIGWTGLLNVVWNSMPFPLKIFALPYGLRVYGSFLKESANLHQLLDAHSSEYEYSKFFRFLRPRYHKVKYVLKTYGIDA